MLWALKDPAADAPHVLSQPGDDATAQDNVVWTCAACGVTVAHEADLTAVGGAIQHVRTNPAGIIFHFRTFARVFNVDLVSPPQTDFSWFEDHAWIIAQCHRCGAHLGWGFVAPSGALAFYALLNHAVLRAG